jgi:hypothetical protein
VTGGSRGNVGTALLHYSVLGGGVTELRVHLRSRPHYRLIELPAPDAVTGERVLLVDAMDGDTVQGSVQLGLRWVSGTPVGRGYLQVRLADPLGTRKAQYWRQRVPPFEQIAATVDTWLNAMRAVHAQRVALEADDAARQAQINALSARLGPKSLTAVQRGRDLWCEVILRPVSADAATRVLAQLTPDELSRARPVYWVRLDRLTPERVAALVEACDADLKPPPPPTAPHAKRARRARRALHSSR